jgi:hypothetical protein
VNDTQLDLDFGKDGFNGIWEARKAIDTDKVGDLQQQLRSPSQTEKEKRNQASKSTWVVEEGCTGAEVAAVGIAGGVGDAGMILGTGTSLTDFTISEIGRLANFRSIRLGLSITIRLL